MERIHSHEAGPYLAEFPSWTVTRQPEGCTDPMVVSFVKRGRNGKLLDQSARWTRIGWDLRRWVPRPPQVPKWLIRKVEDRMRMLTPGGVQ